MRYQLLFKVVSFLMVIAIFNGCFSKKTVVYSGGDTAKSSLNMHKATMKPYTVLGKTYYPTMVNVGDRYSGVASWYGKDFHGKKTSNGEMYNMYALTAAHKTLPMNTIVKVTNQKNGKTIVVRINDRGPFVANRIIDLSKEGASKLGFLNQGTTQVKIEILGFDNIIASKSGDSKQSKQSVIINDFDVQIGAFRKLGGAEFYKNEYNSKKSRYKAIIKKGYHENSIIYRVWLQGFGSEDEVMDFIATGKYPGAFVVRE